MRVVGRLLVAFVVIGVAWAATPLEQPIQVAAQEGVAQRAEWVPLRGRHPVNCTWGTEGAATGNQCFSGSNGTGSTYHPYPAIDFDDTPGGDNTIYSAGHGVVVGWNDTVTCERCPTAGYGNYVLTYHADDDRTVLYAHLEHRSIPSALKSMGAPVTPDTPVGTMGNTGASFGAHLHYEELDGRVEDSPSGATRLDPGPMKGSAAGSVRTYPGAWGTGMTWSKASWDPEWQNPPHGTRYYVNNGGPIDPSVAMALIIDSSGSMTTSDPDGRRRDAALEYVRMVEGLGDEAGIVDFDGSARVASPVVPVAGNFGALEDAIGSINSSGSTDLGAGLDAGCAALQVPNVAAERRAAIFLTDGEGDYSDNAACFGDRGWKVFTIGLGDDADATLLQQIAVETEGQYLQLDESTNLVCEFLQMRALVVDAPVKGCEQTATIDPNGTYETVETVAAFTAQVTFTNTWLGSDIEMTVVSPSGKAYARDVVSDDLVVGVGAAFETLTIANPAPGDWAVTLFGADIPVGGEPFTLSSVAIPAVLQPTAPLVPARVLETRSGAGAATIDDEFVGIGRAAAGSVTELTIAGRGGVPVDATAAMLNVTAVRPGGPGYLTVFPCEEPRPLAANVNYQPGEVVPNAVLAKIDSDGRVCIFTLADTDLVIDVNGYVPTYGTPAPLAPARVLETRAGESTVDGEFEGVGRVASGETLELAVAGRAGVPDDADAVMLNLAAVFPDDNGFLTVFPCGEDRPLAANVNYRPGGVYPNAVLAKIGINGTICIYSRSGTDIVADINGYTK